ncbi:MAG: Fic family protein [Verrucomicrobia bacterium]|jgi:Fic family protein|nr:Fic family protein [Verrucomicrobiota bacterium]
MNSFRNHRLRDHALPMSTAWLFNDIAEAKGKQELFTRQSPQILKALREAAIIQSSESSNRIEGVTVAPDRLRPLVLGNTKPRDRSEQEVQGYRRALNEIHTRHEKLPITPDTLKHLHALCQSASGDAGQFKRIDNEVIELIPGAAPVIRFRCVTAKETPAAVDELCLLYRHALDQDNIPSLIAVAGLVLDFLCIHPFRDGNGRVSRLLTLLALYQHGYEVGRYISLERLVEESKEDYYECLNRSSQRWHEGKHELTPWFNFLLAVIRRGYTEFENRAGEIKAPRGAKTALIEQAIRSFPAQFSIAEIERICPGVSRDMLRHILNRLQRQKQISCVQRGRNSLWQRKQPLN